MLTDYLLQAIYYEGVDNVPNSGFDVPHLLSILNKDNFYDFRYVRSRFSRDQHVIYVDEDAQAELEPESEIVLYRRESDHDLHIMDQQFNPMLGG